MADEDGTVAGPSLRIYENVLVSVEQQADGRFFVVRRTDGHVIARHPATPRGHSQAHQQAETIAGAVRRPKS